MDRIPSKKAVRYIGAARDAYGRLTPFRLGLVVGRAGDTLRPPYLRDPGRRLFFQGVEAGRELAQAMEARERQDTQGLGPKGDSAVTK